MFDLVSELAVVSAYHRRVRMPEQLGHLGNADAVSESIQREGVAVHIGDGVFQVREFFP
jgi:hypothetical protein